MYITRTDCIHVVFPGTVNMLSRCKHISKNSVHEINKVRIYLPMNAVILFNNRYEIPQRSRQLYTALFGYIVKYQGKDQFVQLKFSFTLTQIQ